MKNRTTNLLLLSCLLYVVSAFSSSHIAAAVPHRLGRDDEDVSSHFRNDPSDRRVVPVDSAKTAFPAAEYHRRQRNLRLQDSSTSTHHFDHAIVDRHQQHDRYGYDVGRNDYDGAVEQRHQSSHRTSRAHYRLWSKLPSSKLSKSKSSKNDKSAKSSKTYPAPVTAAYSSSSKSAKAKSSKASTIVIAVAKPSNPTTITASKPSQTTITIIPSYSAKAKATNGSPNDTISSHYFKLAKAKSIKSTSILAVSKSSKTTTVASKSTKAKASNDESPDGAISSDSKSAKAKSSKMTPTATPKSSKTLVFAKTAKSTKSSETSIFGSKSTKAKSKTKASSSESPIGNDDSDGVRLDFEGPSEMPSHVPSSRSSSQPSSRPSQSEQPSGRPSAQPHATPSSPPSETHSSLTSSQPSKTPTVHPSTQPSIQPSPAPAPLTLEQREAIITTKCAGHSVVSRSLALLTMVGEELVSDPEGSLIRQEGPLYDAYVWLAYFDDGILCPPPPPAGGGGDKSSNATLSSSTSPTSLSPSSVDVPIVREERVKRILQRYTLAAMYYALNGDGWTNCSAERKWLGDDDDDAGADEDDTDAIDTMEGSTCLARGSGQNGVRFLDASHECNWFGLSCGGDPDYDTPTFDLDSSLSSNAFSNDLDRYRPITDISLPRNNLQGTIPIEFYKVFEGLSMLNITDGNGVVDGLMMMRGGDVMSAAEEAEIFA